MTTRLQNVKTKRGSPLRAEFGRVCVFLSRPTTLEIRRRFVFSRCAKLEARLMRREPNKTRTKEGHRGGKLHGRIILQKPGENDKPLVLYLHAGYSNRIGIIKIPLLLPLPARHAPVLRLPQSS